MDEDTKVVLDIGTKFFGAMIYAATVPSRLLTQAADRMAETGRSERKTKAAQINGRLQDAYEQWLREVAELGD